MRDGALRRVRADNNNVIIINLMIKVMVKSSIYAL